MKKSIFIPLSIFFSVILSPSISAQNYFKLIELPESSYFQRIAQFSNGDVLVSDIPKNLNPLTGRRGVYLLRIDECGDTVWSKTFYMTDKYLTLDKIFIDEFDLVYVCGSALAGSREDIYVLKLTPSGNEINFRVFKGANIDHFTAAIFAKNKQVTIFGCWYNIVNQGDNHLLVLDENLNQISSKTYSDCETYGEGIQTDDGGFLYHTGFKIVNTRANGTVNWAKKINGLPFAQSEGIPLEVSDGYIFNVYANEKQWFYKISKNGDLVWQSDKITAYYHISHLEELSNGNIMVSYQCPSGDGNSPCFLIMEPSGIISNQYILEIDFPIHAGFSYFTATDDLRINILGNANMRSQTPYSTADYLMQFSLNNLEGDCFSWLPFEEVFPNEEIFTLENETITVANVPMDIEQPTTLIIENLDVSLTEFCEKEIQEFTIDTTLNCTEEWLIELPIGEVIWEDGNTDNPRTLFIPNTYSVTVDDCLTERRYNYNLEKEICQCNIFIPNVFSPNGDGINDQLEIFSECSIENLKITIFNRWGTVVFESTSTDKKWEGIFKGKVASSGVYIIMVNGQSVDSLGRSHEIREVQDVTVLR